jgi:hypothetical protein
MNLANNMHLLSELSSSDFPHKFPENFPRSKAWRSHFLGRRPQRKRNEVFLIFVLDDTYGICKHSIVFEDQLSHRRKNKTYLNFQTDYPKDRILIFKVVLENPKHNAQIAFDALHKRYVEVDKQSKVSWAPPAGINRGRLPFSFAHRV